MKKLLLLGGMLVSLGFVVSAQSDYKVVFDLTSKDSLTQQAAIRWVGEVVKASPEAQVEVVMYGQGVSFVVKDRSAFADAIASLALNKNVSFKVCQVAMKNQGVTADQLIPGVQTVPDGIYEVISKQRQGWGYIKVAR
jgi:intracellular sulfur oxidation DsrE/DsrF family protein